jgi:serine/threonine protein kinase
VINYLGKQNAYHGEINEFISSRYDVIALLSKGGTSEIYKAADTTRNSKVVIKILPPRYSGVNEKRIEDGSEKPLILVIVS